MTASWRPSRAPKPLSRSLDPRPGESLGGYTLRLADRLDRTPGDLLQRMGVPTSTGRRTPAHTGLLLPDSAVDRLAETCRLARQEAVDLTHASRVGSLLAPRDPALSNLVEAAKSAWISPGRTRFCAACLAGDEAAPGYWRLSWQLPWHFACLRHERLLFDCCPACGAPAGKANPGRRDFSELIPNHGIGGLQPDACRHRPAGVRGTPLPPCGYRLSASAGIAAPATEEMLSAQAELDGLLGLEHPSDAEQAPLVAGEPVSLAVWIATLQGLVVLIRASLGLPGAPQPDPALCPLAELLVDAATTPEQRQRLLDPRTPIHEVAQAAVLVPRAVAVLAAATRSRLEEGLSPYLEPVRRDRTGFWKTWLHKFPDPALKRVIKRHRRWGGLTVAVRRPGRSGLRGRNLSQTIPAPHDRLLQPYRQLGISDTGLHRATCVLLYQRCEATVTREEAATALGYDRPAAADNAVARLQGVLEDAGLTTAFEETLDDLEAALASEPPTDWTARLAALNGWTIPPDDWAALRANLMSLQKRHGRQPDWDLRRLVISQIIWEDLTRGEPHRSPAFAAIGTNEDARTRLRTTARQFRGNVENGLLPGVAQVVRAYRDQVEACTAGGQPVRASRSAGAAGGLTGPSADSTLRAAHIDYLVGQTMGRVATVGADGMPCVEPTPFRYNRELGTVDIGGPQTAKTNRYRNVGANGWAAIVIDDVVSLDPWTPRYLEIRGRAETISGGGGHLGRGFAEAFIRIHPTEITSLRIS